MKAMQDPYSDRAPNWYVVDDDDEIIIEGPFQTEQEARKAADEIEPRTDSIHPEGL